MNREIISERGPVEALCYKVATSPKSKVITGLLGIGLPSMVVLGGCGLTQNHSVIEQPRLTNEGSLLVPDQTPVPPVIATAQAQATKIAQYSQEVRDSRVTQTAVVNAAATAETQRLKDQRSAEATATAIIEAARQNPEWVEKQKLEADKADYIWYGITFVLALLTGSVPLLQWELEQVRRKRMDKHG